MGDLQRQILKARHDSYDAWLELQSVESKYSSLSSIHRVSSELRRKIDIANELDKSLMQEVNWLCTNNQSECYDYYNYISKGLDLPVDRAKFYKD